MLEFDIRKTVYIHDDDLEDLRIRLLNTVNEWLDDTLEDAYSGDVDSTIKTSILKTVIMGTQPSDWTKTDIYS